MQMAGDLREGQNNAVELRKENAKELCQLVKALSFRENCTLHFVRSGLQIICDDHCEKATVYIESGVFTSYIIHEEVCFRVPFQELVEVLGMLEGNGVTVKMTYEGFGEPLRLKLVAEEDEYVVQANIHTLTVEPIIEFEINGADIICSAIVKPDALKDAVKMLDESSSSVSIEATPKELSFVSQGDVGRVKTSVPSTSELVEKIECQSSYEKISFKYRTLFIKRMTYALNISHKVALRIDSKGVLCAQFLIERQTSDQIFIEFICATEEDEED